MESLRNKTGRAFLWDLTGNYGGQIIYFIISIVLARLLTPSEFGLVGMSMVFVLILRVFLDMGFASALVQNKHNTSSTYSSVFYLNIIIGFFFTVLLFLTSPLIAKFYNDPQISDLIRWLSISFFVNSFGIVHASILRRELNFKHLNIVILTSHTLSGILAITMAYNGYGVYALIYQQILISFVNVIFVWIISKWRPTLEFSLNEIRKLTKFSFYVFSAQSINQIIKQADILIVGKLFSASTLGFFSRAESMNSLISKNSVGSLNRVFFPVLSSIQDDIPRFRKVFLDVISIVSTVSIMLTGVFFLCGAELIVGLFGKKWEPSVMIFQILIIKGFSYPISAMIINAFLARGKSKQNFHYGNVRKVLQLVPLSIAFLYGFVPFLYAVVIINILGWILNSYFTHISLDISFNDQMKVVLPILLVTTAIIFLVYYIVPNDFSYWWATVRVLLFAVLFFLYLYYSNSLFLKELLIYKSKIWQLLKA